MRYAVTIDTGTARVVFATYAAMRTALAVAGALRRVGIVATAVRVGT